MSLYDPHLDTMQDHTSGKSWSKKPLECTNKNGFWHQKLKVIQTQVTNILENKDFFSFSKTSSTWWDRWTTVHYLGFTFDRVSIESKQPLQNSLKSLKWPHWGNTSYSWWESNVTHTSCHLWSYDKDPWFQSHYIPN